VKALVVGLGSMGQRRVRNLIALGERDIIGLDVRADRRAEAAQKYGISTAETFEAALAASPDFLIISTAPAAHESFVLAAAERGIPYFCELNLVRDGLLEAERVAASHGSLAAPSTTMRHHPAVALVRAALEAGRIGRPLAFTHHSGQYLPDWHPWEDYRSFFVAEPRTAACREVAAIEMSWLCWLFGLPVRSRSLGGKVSDLDVKVDDVVHFLFETSSGAIGHLQADVLARRPIRALRVVGSEGTVEWDATRGEVVVDAAGTRDVLPCAASSARLEAMYVEEMRLFLEALRNERRYPYTFREECLVLEALEAAERDARREESRASP